MDNKSGKNYYLPTNTMMTGTIYNQKIFDELKLKPAKTLDESTENLRAIKNAYPDKTPLFFSGKEAVSYTHLVCRFKVLGNVVTNGCSEMAAALVNGIITLMFNWPIHKK